jgi:hypothetical protein
MMRLSAALCNVLIVTRFEQAFYLLMGDAPAGT